MYSAKSMPEASQSALYNQRKTQLENQASKLELAVLTRTSRTQSVIHLHIHNDACFLVFDFATKLFHI